MIEAGVRSSRKSDHGSVGHFKDLKVYPGVRGKLSKNF